MPKGKGHGGKKFIQIKVEDKNGNQKYVYRQEKNYSDKKETDFRKDLAKKYAKVLKGTNISDNKPSGDEE